MRDHCVTGVQTYPLLISSRRRHTRSLCDWSSDVCSSDLNGCLTPHNSEDVAVDSKNNVFTIVRGETPILVFNSQGKFLYGWGKGMIAGPHGIYIDSNDNVFCVDTKNHVVSKFTTDGKLLMTLGVKGVPSDSRG